MVLCEVVGNHYLGVVIMKVLINNGANPKLVDKDGNILLHIAARSGLGDLVEYLL